MMVNDLLNNLNSEQRQAVTYPEKSVLVLAGAGSGKTRVLTTRIAWLLSTGKADINSVMAVTFTNKAAREMGARLTTMLSKPVQSMWLGTFHGLCHRFLRLHHKKAGLSSTFQIMDTADQLSLIKRLLKQRNINPEFIQPRALQQFINSKKEEVGRAAVLSADDSYTQTLIECFADYERICQDEGLVDFAELILRSYEVLSSDESLRRHYQQKFRHILVDEFQDTNALQYQWIRLLAGGGACVFAVGDDDQSIYRFRGADVQNMNYLLRDFSIKNPIKLEQNYRSVGNILQAANAVIANNRSRLGKNLRTNAEDGEKLRFYHAYDDSSEARFVVREIQERLKENTSPQDIAILYRNNAQSRVLEQQLASENIPYRIYGGVRFYERQEVKLVLNYLRLVLDPDDNNAFLYIINTPSRSIGPSTIKKMQEQAQASKTSLFEVACAMALDSPKIDAF
ncbi:MAG: UvrD-helicase domain-containing protein, partial [Neisseriaceae bacterium]|nr:UvrD-helicase domain-containing protein [Neisseriaceae bacterium]